jgi:hypothetical protein
VHASLEASRSCRMYLDPSRALALKKQLRSTDSCICSCLRNSGGGTVKLRRTVKVDLGSAGSCGSFDGGGCRYETSPGSYTPALCMGAVENTSFSNERSTRYGEILCIVQFQTSSATALGHAKVRRVRQNGRTRSGLIVEQAPGLISTHQLPCPGTDGNLSQPRPITPHFS